MLQLTRPKHHRVEKDTSVHNDTSLSRILADSSYLTFPQTIH